MRLLTPIIISAVLLASASALADDTRILGKNLKQNLSNHEVSLRVPYANKQLEFGNDGTCRKDCARGSWVRDATILISDVDVAEKEVRIWAHRLIVFYDLDGKRTAIRTTIVVEIRAPLPSQPTEASIGDLLRKIFLTSGETIPNSAPADLLEWRKRSDAGSTVSDGKLQAVGETADHRDVFNPGKDVKPPKAVSTLDPQYPDAAGKGEGTVTTATIVDQFGFPQVLRVERADSRAYIQPAISALSQWTFKPATYNGTPVACRISVDINFRIH